MAVAYADFIPGDQTVTDLVDAAPAGTPKHLVDFIRPDRHFQVIAPVGVGSQGHATQGKIDAGGQAHRRHNHSKLAGLGQGLDHSGPCAVAQPAMVIRHPRLQHSGQVITHEILLPCRQLERVGIRQIAGDVGGERLGRTPAWCKNQNRPKPLSQRLGREPRPIAANLSWDVVVEHTGINLLERHRPVVMPNPLGLPAQSLQPTDHVFGIGHTAAEHQELGLRRRHGDGQLVIEATVGVAEHLILVDYQQPRAVAGDEPVFLRLERGNNDRRVEVLRQVAGGDADVPAARPPLGQLVIGQGAGWHGVNRLARISALVGPQLENEGFAGPGCRVNDDIPAGPQMLHRLLLPQVRHDDLVEGGKTIQLRPKLPHKAGLANNGKKRGNKGFFEEIKKSKQREPISCSTAGNFANRPLNRGFARRCSPPATRPASATGPALSTPESPPE